MNRSDLSLVEASWRKSSYSSSQGQCVEVGHEPRTVGVRDSKNRDAGALAVSTTTWSAFVTGLKHAHL